MIHFFFRYRMLAGCCVLLSALLALPGAVSAAANDDASHSQRSQFLAAAAALATGREADFERRRRALDDYPLAAYLDYAALRRGIRTLHHDHAQQFLQREHGRQLADQFRREWLAELARRSDWRGFLAFDDDAIANSANLRCLRARALIEAGRDDGTAREQVLSLWHTGQSLPDACDPALAQARERGWLDADAITQRLHLALEAGNAGLASHLARQLPADQRSDGERLAQAVRDPVASLKAATTWPDSANHREAASWALRRRARQSIDDAIDHWQHLSSRLRFDAEQSGAITRELALYAAVAYRTDAADWFDRVPQARRDTQLNEWRLRTALAGKDWPAARDLLGNSQAALPDSPRLRYWHARALEETGQGAAAHLLYQSVAGQAQFHGFLAADRIGAPYTLCPLDVQPEPAQQARVRQNPDLARALELHAVGWRSEAVRAFEHGLRNSDEPLRLHALSLADAQGWHDRAVFNLRAEDELRYYALRFPVAERALVERESTANGLDAAWVYALIRAESAWQPHARSHANAYGLMQLLPATGQRMARELQLPWNGTSTLLDPQHNIRLGTRYLSQQTERFSGSPWLASAAYNAGPAPVERWLGQRAQLPADAFIETIPYHETRDYVPRILAFSVIYDWRLHGKARSLASRLPDPGRREDASSSVRADRTFLCPAPNAPSRAD